MKQYSFLCEVSTNYITKMAKREFDRLVARGKTPEDAKFIITRKLYDISNNRSGLFSVLDNLPASVRRSNTVRLTMANSNNANNAVDLVRKFK